MYRSILVVGGLFVLSVCGLLRPCSTSAEEPIKTVKVMVLVGEDSHATIEGNKLWKKQPYSAEEIVIEAFGFFIDLKIEWAVVEKEWKYASAGITNKMRWRDLLRVPPHSVKFVVANLAEKGPQQYLQNKNLDDVLEDIERLTVIEKEAYKEEFDLVIAFMLESEKKALPNLNGAASRVAIIDNARPRPVVFSPIHSYAPPIHIPKFKRYNSDIQFTFNDAPHESASFCHVLGMASPFGQHVIISDIAHSRDTAVTVVIHEIAHIFGVCHVNDSSSVMSPLLSSNSVQFNDQLCEVIQESRYFDFSIGPASLYEDQRQRIQDLWKHNRRPNRSRSPLYKGFMYRGDEGNANNY